MKHLLKLIGVFLLSNLICIGLLVAASLVLAFISFASLREKETVSLDELGQLIHAPIPADATDINVDPATVNGFTIKFSFSAPPTSANQFASKFCDGQLYAGYDPFMAKNSYAARRGDVIIKAQPYAYFSSSRSVPSTVYGNRCLMIDRTGQIRVDKTNPQKYSVRFEMFTYTCDVDLMCDAPYGFDNISYHPLRRSAPFPLVIYGFKNAGSRLDGDALCVETAPDSFSSWDRAPFRFDEMNGAAFELFIDDISIGKAVIDRGQLVVDYSTGQFIGIHESPEYCFRVDAKDGVHQMSVDVKTRTGQAYHYAWPFTVQTSTSALAE